MGWGMGTGTGTEKATDSVRVTGLVWARVKGSATVMGWVTAKGLEPGSAMATATSSETVMVMGNPWAEAVPRAADTARRRRRCSQSRCC